MNRALIAMGGNVPFRDKSPAAALSEALDILGEDGQIRIEAVAKNYRSSAVPPGSGPDFVNSAAELATSLGADALLGRLHQVEATLGRVRQQRWGPRTCDLDLIAMGGQVLPDADTQRAWIARGGPGAIAAAPDRLILPHPRLQERAFVLLPLADIAPDWRHPTLGKTIRELLDAIDVDQRSAVTPIG